MIAFIIFGFCIGSLAAITTIDAGLPFWMVLLAYAFAGATGTLLSAGTSILVSKLLTRQTAPKPVLRI